MTTVDFTPDDVDAVTFAHKFLAHNGLYVDAITLQELARRMREARKQELRRQILGGDVRPLVFAEDDFGDD